MNIINLGILAHIDAGKTSVTENLLFASGATEKCGRVDNGDTITDSMDIEKRRGITVRASTGKIGVCCHSGLAERNAEYHVNSIFYMG